MSLLEITVKDAPNATTCLYINGKMQKLSYKGVQNGGICYFSHTDQSPLHIRITTVPQTRSDKVFFCVFAFLDILTSDIGQFLKNQCEFLQSEYVIRLTGDAKMTIEGDKNGLHIAESSENCQILSEKHEKEKISKRLLRAALIPIFVLIEIPLIAFLIIGIISLFQSNYGVSATMFALALIWGILTGHGLKQTLKK